MNNTDKDTNKDFNTKLNIFVERGCIDKVDAIKALNAYKEDPSDSNQQLLQKYMDERQVELDGILALQKEYDTLWSQFEQTMPPINNGNMKTRRTTILKNRTAFNTTMVTKKNRTNYRKKLVNKLKEYMDRIPVVNVDGPKLKQKIQDTEAFIAKFNFKRQEDKVHLEELVKRAKLANGPFNIQPIDDIISPLVTRKPPPTKKRKRGNTTPNTLQKKSKSKGKGKSKKICGRCRKVLDISPEMCLSCFEKSSSLEYKRINVMLSSLPVTSPLRPKAETLTDRYLELYRSYMNGKTAVTAKSMMDIQSQLLKLCTGITYSREDLEEEDSLVFGDRDRDRDDDADIMDEDDDELDFSTSESSSYNNDVEEEEEEFQPLVEEETVAKMTMDYVSQPGLNTVDRQVIFDMWRNHKYTSLNKVIYNQNQNQGEDSTFTLYEALFYFVDDPESTFTVENQPLYFNTVDEAKVWGKQYMDRDILRKHCRMRIRSLQRTKK